MIIKRWQAPLLPDKKQIFIMFKREGLEPYEETLKSKQSVKTHRHPFDEVRMILSGELKLDISGNKLLLRAGDRIIIPSNTKHSKMVDSEDSCVCICAQKI